MSKLIQALCVLLLPSVLAGQVFVQNAKTAKISLIETGDVFHGDEIKARSGEKAKPGELVKEVAKFVTLGC